MKQIIDGLRYNTDTAEELATLRSPTDSISDFKHHNTSVYRTDSGRYFLAGEGGPLSMWARSTGNGGRTDGSGIRPLTEGEARGYLEECGRDGAEALEKYFTIEDA